MLILWKQVDVTLLLPVLLPSARRHRLYKIVICIMYVVVMENAFMSSFFPASSKWIRIIVQNPRSNLTLYFGVWRYCAQGYDCNGDQGKCSTVHRCRFVTDDDMKAHPESRKYTIISFPLPSPFKLPQVGASV